MKKETAEYSSQVTQKTKSASWRRWVILCFIAALLFWLATDLLIARKTSLREFDAREVARLETAMWRSYYDKERVKLFGELAELLRQQYRLPYVKSNLVAFQAAKAAFVFKGSHNRTEAQKALPNLVNFYQAINEVGDIKFDIEKAAKLELEWWIIHRERDTYSRADLDRSLAELPAAVYQIPVEKFQEHARLRAEAMLLRDEKAAQGGVAAEDWKKIDALLQASWESLHKAVQ